MTILLALIPLSLVLLVLMVLAFLWAVRNGQFDDLDTPPLDMLRDDDQPAPPTCMDALVSREAGCRERPHDAD